MARASSDNESTLPAEASTLIEVNLDKQPRNVLGLVFLAFISLLILAVVTAIGASGLYLNWLEFLVLAVLLPVCAVGLFRWRARRVRRKFRHEIERNRSIDDKNITEALAGIASFDAPFSGDACIRELTKILIENNHRGATLRICQETHAAPIDPICVGFEPVALDEASTAFVALTEASTETTLEAGADTGKRRKGPAARRWSGWIMPVAFGLLFSLELFGSIRRSRPGADLLLYSALFLVSLFIPSLKPIMFTKQWFLVPGGAVLRRPKGIWRSGWHIRMFARRDCVMCVYQSNRSQWRATISDSEIRETIFGTQTEMHLLLRAWLSPLDPPPRERLTDLE
jgi:hypothetical protein